MRLCGECGLFCSFGAMWPSGVCAPRVDRIVNAADAGCVMWRVDVRGVDQSDGERGKCESSLLRECSRDCSRTHPVGARRRVKGEAGNVP